MMRRSDFSPVWNERKREAIRLLSNFLLPYRDTHSYRHWFVTSAYLRLLTETEYADPGRMHELQLLRLQKIIASAETVPWWRERFEKIGLTSRSLTGLSDLERLSPVTKQSFSGVPLSACTAEFYPGHERLLLHRTSGTTGEPFEWGVDKNVLFVETASYFHRALAWYGVRRRTAGPFIAAFVHWSYGVPGVEFLWNPIAKNETVYFRRMLSEMRSRKLRVLFSYPTNLILFTKKLVALHESVPFDLVLTTGQRLDDDHRAYVESRLGCPVVNLYGAREFGQMAIECPRRRHWYHVNSERLIVEITDEDGRCVPDGTEGIVTITSLENRAMPLIRYQLGDRGRLVTEACPCGRTLPLLEFYGRGIDFIRLSDGEQVPFRHINLVVLLRFFEDIEFYQIEQTALDRLVFRFKLKRGTPEAFEKRFLPKVRVYIGDELHVAFEYPEDWEVTVGRKVRMFIPFAGS